MQNLAMFSFCTNTLQNIFKPFPSGHGATLNVDGEVELDAIIVDGRTLASGAVSCVTNIANPVSLARAVMEKVFLFYFIIYCCVVFSFFL